MAKLRHLGIRTEDTGKLTSFYVDVFDMKVIHKSKEEGGTIFLSDGYFNVSKFFKLTYTGTQNAKRSRPGDFFVREEPICGVYTRVLGAPL
jgi:catechol 2,3-dioxygenase-like lactoylglutathione lyase family enzyme